MRISLKDVLSQLFLIVFMMMLFACSGNKKDQNTPQPNVQYADWQKYSYKNLRLFYPPGYKFADSMNSYANKYLTSIRKDCQFLNIPIPDDTLLVFFYNNFGHCQEFTGNKFPSANKDTIHFYTPVSFGTPLMAYLIPYWSTVETRHLFIYHGMLKILDYSGRDFHQLTFDYIDSQKFIPLYKLAEDKKLNAYNEWYQSAHAASFVDFIAYKYGIDALKVLHDSPLSFDSSVTGLFHITVDSLENEWLDVIGKAIGRR